MYYFSDNAMSSTYRQNLLALGCIDTCALYYYSPSTFLNQLTLLQSQGVFSGINNAYVIFEIREPFPEETLTNDDQLAWLTSWLLATFSSLKSRNCEIMFICGTDEALLKDDRYKEFLDYVDIHVNVDIRYLFYANVFYRMQQECGGTPIEQTTIFLDASLSSGVTMADSDGAFIDTIFMPYLRTKYISELMGSNLTNYEVMNNHQIKLICHINQTIYYDVAAGTYLDSAALNTDFCNAVSNEHFCAIGTSENGLQYTEQWLTSMLDLAELLQCDIPRYIYDPDNSAQQLCQEKDAYRAGAPLDVYPVMADFVQGYDMTGYNNYDGECNITYMALPTGPNGWMLCLTNVFHIEGWDLYMTQAQIDYYLNFDNDSIFVYED